jgi:AraC-like DNA-binding protein
MASMAHRQVKLANAIVALANYYQFGQGERLTQPCVRSRMLLWCKAGQGAVRVNTETCPLAADAFVLMPWDHSVTYESDRNDPLFVGAIHMIPFHDRAHRLVHEVSHRPGDAFWDCRWRKDVLVPGLEGVQHGSLARDPALRHLAEHIVQRFAAAKRREWELRRHAELLLSALRDHFTTSEPPGSTLPAELQVMMQFVRSHLYRKLSLEDVAQFAERSPSSVGRLFRRHLRMTTVTFIIRAKMEVARQLLSTSRLPVAEVGRRVGIEDAYYFSKLFRKTVGKSPLEYRKASSLL